jgi:hypothetical protein
MLLTIGQGQGQPPGPPTFGLTDIYVVDAQGKGRRLEGVSGLRNVAWAPNGKALIGFEGQRFGQPFNLYLIPVVDGEATVVRNVLSFTNEGFIPSSAAGHRVAFIAHGVGGDAYLSVYDTDTRRVRLVGPAPAADMQSLHWAAGQEQVLVRTASGNQNTDQIIDVNTGASLPGSYQDLYPPQGRDTLSPGGRYVANLAEPQAAATHNCPGVFRLTVTEKQSGAAKTLLECSTGTSGYVTWLNETQLIAGIAACWACESIPSRIWLVDVDRGTAQSLTEGLEDWAFAVPSPDKGRLVVGGKRLRVYGVDGSLMRDLGPAPAGFVYESATWAPDGSAFAFILRPASWPVGP